MQEGLFVFEAIDESDCNQRRQMCRTPVSTSTVVRNDAFEIQPNPAGEFIDLYPSEDILGEHTLTLTDIMGRSVLNQTLNFTGDKQSLSLPSQIATGIYLLSVQGEDFIFTEKIVIEK